MKHTIIISSSSLSPSHNDTTTSPSPPSPLPLPCNIYTNYKRRKKPVLIEWSIWSRPMLRLSGSQNLFLRTQPKVAKGRILGSSCGKYRKRQLEDVGQYLQTLSLEGENPGGPNTDEQVIHQKERRRAKRPHTTTACFVSLTSGVCYNVWMVSFLIDTHSALLSLVPIKRAGCGEEAVAGFLPFCSPYPECLRLSAHTAGEVPGNRAERICVVRTPIFFVPLPICHLG